MHEDFGMSPENCGYCSYYSYEDGCCSISLEEARANGGWPDGCPLNDEEPDELPLLMI